MEMWSFTPGGGKVTSALTARVLGQSGQQDGTALLPKAEPSSMASDPSRTPCRSSTHSWGAEPQE